MSVPAKMRAARLRHLAACVQSGALVGADQDEAKRWAEVLLDAANLCDAVVAMRKNSPHYGITLRKFAEMAECSMLQVSGWCHEPTDAPADFVRYAQTTKGGAS